MSTESVNIYCSVIIIIVIAYVDCSGLLVICGKTQETETDTEIQRPWRLREMTRKIAGKETKEPKKRNSCTILSEYILVRSYVYAIRTVIYHLIIWLNEIFIDIIHHCQNKRKEKEMHITVYTNAQAKWHICINLLLFIYK